MLKINQITSHNVMVSPLVNNGLTYLHIFDYCMPPAALPQLISVLDINKQQLLRWPATATSKIQLAGINSIIVNYEDDKFQVKKRLKILVQISDATGNLIKTNYFPLMNLHAILTNTMDTIRQSEPLGVIVPGSYEDYENTEIKNEDKEFTAVFILSAHRAGVLNVQFEAKSDQQLIRSHLKEIQLYSPLSAQPKYVELVEGAYFEITTTGGPLLTELVYEIIEEGQKKPTVQVTTAGIIKALHIGQVKVVVKSVSNDQQKRVYSDDSLVVNVVRLYSVQLYVPIRSIKVGNEMPVYIMANERKISPVSFASCSSLKYEWKVSDQQIGSLQHVLMNQGGLGEDSFSLRFRAERPGVVKVGVKVKVMDPFTKQISYLVDSIEVTVFEEAYFTHFTPSYLMFKRPELKELYRQQPTSQLLQGHTILMTPGSQFQLKTNLDKTGNKINFHYQLAFFDQLDINYCNDSTIQISKEGIITAAPLEAQMLKNLKECVFSVLISMQLNELQSQVVKQQSLAYVVKVKSVVYSMLRLRKLPKLGTESDIKGFVANAQYQLHQCFHDDLGDLFDVTNTYTRYSLSRHDLVEFTQLNGNFFVHQVGGEQPDAEKYTNKLHQTYM